ncbi:MAG: hypothetical protein JWO81_501 [Alphaproteobacteria bacterium]|nr:hypothetical protein [Alphaproteobacteria bacterium]
MTGRSLLLLAAATAALAACTVHRAGPAAAVPATGITQWRMIATRDDHRRVRDWRKAWVKALGQARPGHKREIAAEGRLLDPDAALPDPAPPPGAYRCRTLKLGARGGTGLDYVAYPAFRCRIEAQGDGSLAFVKVDGAQRAVGRIFPENSRRMVFLGTLQLGDEQGTLRYGHDQARDLAAIVERVGERRWRLAFPYPHYESTLDVVELVPAG